MGLRAFFRIMYSVTKFHIDNNDICTCFYYLPSATSLSKDRYANEFHWHNLTQRAASMRKKYLLARILGLTSPRESESRKLYL